MTMIPGAVRQTLKMYYNIDLPINPTSEQAMFKARQFDAIGACMCADICRRAANTIRGGEGVIMRLTRK